MTDEWFQLYGYNVVINKKYVPPNIIKQYLKKNNLYASWKDVSFIEIFNLLINIVLSLLGIYNENEQVDAVGYL